VALGTARVAAKNSHLREYPHDIHTGREHIKALVRRVVRFRQARPGAIDSALDARDADTADLFTQVSRGTDKLLWFVEAHAENRE